VLDVDLRQPRQDAAASPTQDTTRRLTRDVVGPVRDTAARASRGPGLHA
jgi:hypothetical protein